MSLLKSSELLISRHIYTSRLTDYFDKFKTIKDYNTYVNVKENL